MGHEIHKVRRGRVEAEYHVGTAFLFMHLAA